MLGGMSMPASANPIPGRPSGSPRAIIASDLPGFGRVALAAAIPVLSAMGVQACALPTAILSTHGAYPGMRSQSLTGPMREMLAHWQELGLIFDGLATGFVPELDQFGLLDGLVDSLRGQGAAVLVDPVMGDNGRLYGIFDASHVAAMRGLVRRATVITPNLTEAALLLGRPADQRPASPVELEAWLEELAGGQVELVVITSAPVFGRQVGPGEDREWTGIAARQLSMGRVFHFDHPREPVGFPGTGDVFAACLFGGLLQGWTAKAALDQAAAFITGLVGASVRHLRENPGAYPREGLQIESFLHGQKEIPG